MNQSVIKAIWRRPTISSAIKHRAQCFWNELKIFDIISTILNHQKADSDCKHIYRCVLSLYLRKIIRFDSFCFWSLIALIIANYFTTQWSFTHPLKDQFYRIYFRTRLQLADLSTLIVIFLTYATAFANYNTHWAIIATNFRSTNIYTCA